MKSLGQSPTEEELTRMIQSVDDNGNNEIDFQEFLILMSSKKSISDDPDRELKDAFAVFDTDGSGLISRSELKGLLNNLGQLVSDEELDAMMGEVDKDGNGEIDFEEFKAMMVRCLQVYIIPLYLYGMCVLAYLISIFPRNRPR
jgi:calmodulin